MNDTQPTADNNQNNPPLDQTAIDTASFDPNTSFNLTSAQDLAKTETPAPEKLSAPIYATDKPATNTANSSEELHNSLPNHSQNFETTADIPSSSPAHSPSFSDQSQQSTQSQQPTLSSTLQNSPQDPSQPFQNPHGVTPATNIFNNHNDFQSLPAEPEPKPIFTKPKFPIKFAVIAAVILVLLTGGGVFAFFTWRNRPENIILDAFTHLVKSPSVQIVRDGKATIKNPELANLLGEISFNDEIIAQSLVSEQGLSFDIPIKDPAKPSQPISLSFKFDSAVNQDAKVFFKFGGLQKSVNSLLKSSLAAAQIPPEVTQKITASDHPAQKLLKNFDDQWWRFDIKEVAEKFIPESEERQKTIDAYTCLTDQVKKLDTHDQTLIDLFKKHPYLTIKKLDRKSQRGTSFYSTKVDSAILIKFLDDLIDTPLADGFLNCGKDLTKDFDLAKTKSQLKTQLSKKISEEHSETFSGFNLEIENWSHKLVAASISISEETIDYSAEITFTYKDKPVTTRTPDESQTKPVFQIYEELQKIAPSIMEGLGGLEGPRASGPEVANPHGNNSGTQNSSTPSRPTSQPNQSASQPNPSNPSNQSNQPQPQPTPKPLPAPTPQPQPEADNDGFIEAS